MKNAREYFPNVDIYVFPNTTMEASSMMGNLVNTFKSANDLNTNMVWIQVKGAGQYWSTSASTNQAWLQQAISAVNSQYQGCGVSSGCVGILTNSNDWTAIMGSTTQFSGQQLWYSELDGEASFADFQSFGGWTKANIKQYRGATALCSVAINKDYY